MPAETFAVRHIGFEAEPPVEAGSPGRADIACFVGFVSRRRVPLPVRLGRWLRERGWSAGVYQREGAHELLDVPVPIDTWETFHHLFAWDDRRADGGGRSVAPLGAAVRTFFAEGGRKCYVVRVGDAAPPGAGGEERRARVADLIPGFPAEVAVSPFDRTTWRGVGPRLGLPDVAFLCLPDLPEAFAAAPERVTLPAPPPGAGVFEICDETETETSLPLVVFGPPRVNAAGYRAWTEAVYRVGRFVADHAPEIHLIAALPLPEREGLEQQLARFLAAEVFHGPRPIASAFVQLAYPWLLTQGPGGQPGALEAPDGTLAGILARVALVRGAYHSAAGEAAITAVAPEPLLGGDQLAVEDGGQPPASVLGGRISLFDQGPRGVVLGSDVTTSWDPAYRPAAVSRLVAVLLKALRELGERVVFEFSGDQLWARVRRRLEAVLTEVWTDGGLGGVTPGEAFQVRCDRSTMTQNDLDAGRLIAEVTFLPAAPIERITVRLALSEAGAATVDTGVEGAVE
jgi:hypothetical protein